MTERKLKLYETTEALTAIDDELVENGGELTPEIEANLRGLKQRREDLAEWIVTIANEKRAQADGLKILIKDLQAKVKSRTKHADSLERYLLAEMQMLGDKGKEIGTQLYTIKRARVGRPQIDVAGDIAVELLDDKFVRVVPEKRELDKNAVYDWLKETDGIPKEIGQFKVGDFNVTTRERLSVR